MTSRSLAWRLAGKPDRPVRGYRPCTVPERSGTVQVTVTVTDFATHVSQSFLIMPGYTATALLTGCIESPGSLPRVFKVPVRIQARVT